MFYTGNQIQDFLNLSVEIEKLANRVEALEDLAAEYESERQQDLTEGEIIAFENGFSAGEKRALDKIETLIAEMKTTAEIA
ncbi:hypothetical protein ACV5Z5_004648 [Salmonella enterica subsp. enterica]